MSVSFAKFTETLRASGLMSGEDFQAFLAGIPPEIDAGDPQAVARELIRQGRLTAFQATAIYQGKSKGLIFGEYLVLDKLGAGGMGRVFKAVHRRMQRVVALKVLPKASLESRAAVERFEREVRAAAKLLHPNIVAAHDAGVHESIHYLVIEFVDGPDLARLLKDRGALPIPVALNYMLQAAKGLKYAHSRGVIHRDIKPSNILVNREGVVKILDMGLARLNDSRDSQQPPPEVTRVGQVIGTIDYMAPEQAEHTDLADERSDIYSLGCTLYRLLTGSIPFPAESFVKKLIAHREAPIPRLEGTCPGADGNLQSLLNRMLAKRPQERFETMEQVESAIESLLAGHEIRSALSSLTPPKWLPQDEMTTFLRNLSGDTGSNSSDASDAFPAPPIDIAIQSDPKPGEEASAFQAIPKLWLAAFLLAVLGSLGFLAAQFLLPGMGTVRIRVATQHLDECTVQVDGKVQSAGTKAPISLPLRAGKHEIKLHRRGYRTEHWAFDLKRGQIKPLTPNWQPLTRRTTASSQPNE